MDMKRYLVLAGLLAALGAGALGTQVAGAQTTGPAAVATATALPAGGTGTPSNPGIGGDAPAPPEYPADQGPPPAQESPLAIIAGKLGLTEDAVRTALENNQSVAQLATAHNVALSSLVDAVVADPATHLAQQVKDGQLTQAEADQRLADLRSRTTADFQRPGLPPPPHPPGDRPGPGQPGDGRESPLAIIAGKLGLTEAAVRTALENNQSVAQLATAHNVTLSSLVDAVVADPAAHLAQQVKDGQLTQAEADQRLADLRSRTTADFQRPGLPPPPHPPGDRPGPGQPGDGRESPLAIIAGKLGLTEAAVRTALENNQSVAQLATAHNVTLSSLVDAVVADPAAHLAQQVKDGQLTQRSEEHTSELQSQSNL